MYFDFSAADGWTYLPAVSVATVYKLFTDPGYSSDHRIIDREKYILFFTMAGKGRVEVDHVPHEVEGNTLLCANAGTALRYFCTGEQWNFWLVEFKTDKPLIPANRVFSLGFRSEYHEAFNASLEWLRHKRPLLAAAHFQTLCCMLAGELERTVPNRDTRLFNQCVAYMEEHIGSFTVNRFCTDTGISPRTLLNLFRRMTGEAPYQYYQRIRAERSKEYLESTDFSVAQIAARLGYLNSGHFSRIFKGYFGQTPRRYRAAFRLLE